MTFLPWFLSIFPLALCPATAGDAVEPTTAEFHSSQSGLLARWFEQLGAPGHGESFGDFLARAALLKHHHPYLHLRDTMDSERPRIDLTHFDCVSLIDTSLALARCAWLGDPTEACFLQELVATRYRDGTVHGFASRLHYFEDWIDDNRARNRLEDRTRELGGILLRRPFFYISENRHRFPPMNDPDTREALELTESRLSRRIHTVVLRSSIRDRDTFLDNGDVVGVVTTEPGRLISHAGFVVLSGQRTARLLHASSHHRQVVLTAESLSTYILRRTERWGIIVARPLPPIEPVTAR